MSTPSTNTEMKSASFKSAVVARIVTNVSAVRENETGYLFVTVLNASGAASNIYFGKKSAEQVSVDDKLTGEQLMNAEFVLATNEDGDARIKLSLSGESDYTDVLSMFGVSADHEAEVLAALKADMTTREEDETEEEEEDDDAKAVADAIALKKAKALAKANAKK